MLEIRHYAYALFQALVSVCWGSSYDCISPDDLNLAQMSFTKTLQTCMVSLLMALLFYIILTHFRGSEMYHEYTPAITFD